jgi:clan AA aspartic protease (TIGR02281 family)
MRIALIGALLLCMAWPAQAQDCRNLIYLTGVPISASGAPVVPVSINQKPAQMILDSGAVATRMTRAWAETMGLREAQSPIQVPDFEIGKLKFDAQLQVTPLPITGSLAGLLSLTMLRDYDVDIDFGSHRLNFFSPDHCPGLIAYWAPDVMASLPITLKDAHINIPVTVNGQAMTAVVDTGASQTFMNMNDARRLFGLGETSPDMTTVNNINGDPRLSGFRHHFATLTFGDVTIKNPQVIILPDQTSSSDPGTLSEISLGMDVLAQLHLYVAFQERKLYMTPADDNDGKILRPVMEPVSPQKAQTVPP